jgi:hypothetical protein
MTDDPRTRRDRDSSGDDLFKQSIADLSRRLGERQSAVDSQAEAQARRAALAAYDQARARRLKWALGATGATAAAAGLAYLLIVIGIPVAPQSSPSKTASLAPTPVPIVMAAAPAPEPLPPSPSPPIASERSPPVVPAEVERPLRPAPPQPTSSVPPSLILGHAVAQAASAANDQPAPAPLPAAPSPPPQAVPAEPAPVQVITALRSEEVGEIQEKLRSFGFDPGPGDGVAGPRTESAVRRYQQDRAQPQTGQVDRALLTQVRQDHAPPVAIAQRAPRPAAPRAANPPRAGSSDPFEPLRTAGDRFNEWMRSVFR